MKVLFAFVVIVILVALGGVYKFSGKNHSESVEIFTNRVISENARDQETVGGSDPPTGGDKVSKIYATRVWAEMLRGTA